MDDATRITGIAHFTFHEGQVARFKELARECRRIVAERDTGTLRYEVFFTEDETGAVVIEEYTGERALLEHGRNLGDELSQAVLATGEVHGELVGDLSPALLDHLRGGPVTAYTPRTV